MITGVFRIVCDSDPRGKQLYIRNTEKQILNDNRNTNEGRNCKYVYFLFCSYGGGITFQIKTFDGGHFKISEFGGILELKDELSKYGLLHIAK